ncbi:MAG TPA: DUF6089 family protein [Chitinophagaceae bacterium]|nr:DUF6089 family protein [Chitinophagaceae bacterium]
MKKLFFIWCFISSACFSQNFFISLRAGISNYQGDLQDKRLSFKNSKFIGSVGARYDLSEHIVLRSYLSFTTLVADDKNSSKASARLRNLNFTTHLQELEISGQYNFFNLNDRWWSPYFFTGFGLFHFKPYTAAGSTRIFLQPLSTEGQGISNGLKKYKLIQPFIPLGVGIDYVLTEDLRIGLEFGFRKTFTDYIDDVSNRYVDYATLLNAKGQTAVDIAYRGDELPGGAPYPIAGTLRGNVKNKDNYYFTTLTVTWRPFVDAYKRTSGISALPKRKKRVGCPGIK